MQWTGTLKTTTRNKSKQLSRVAVANNVRTKRLNPQCPTGNQSKAFKVLHFLSNPPEFQQRHPIAPHSSQLGFNPYSMLVAKFQWKFSRVCSL